MHKTCKTCKRETPPDRLVGYECKDCKATKQRERVANNPEYYRSMELRSRYGIDLPGYYQLLTEQEFRCAVCGNETPGCERYTYFPVDHDHTTGYVRGLLCSGCNQGIGYLKDNPAILRKAADYLEAPPARKRWKK